jgi:hypothetical protein
MALSNRSASASSAFAAMDVPNITKDSAMADKLRPVWFTSRRDVVMSAHLCSAHRFESIFPSG